MVTNYANKLMKIFNTLPEIDIKNKKSSRSGMMAPLTKKATKQSKGYSQNQPIISTLKMYQKIKRTRMES